MKSPAPLATEGPALNSLRPFFLAKPHHTKPPPLPSLVEGGTIIENYLFNTG